MSRGIPLGILLALAIVSGAGGYAFLDLGIGGQVYPGSARGSSMGEVGWLTEENSLSTIMNPATLGTIDSPDVTFAYQYHFLHETRAFPAYDSFDALLGYNVYATNKNFYQNLAFGLSTGVLPRALGLSFGFAYSPVYDMNYDYMEEFRDRETTSQPADELIARYYLIGEGTLKALSFGAGLPLAEEASLGVSLDYVFGSYDLIARMDWVDGQPETRDMYSASNQGGVRFRIAGRIKAGSRLEFGFEGTTRCTMKGDFSASTGNDMLWFLPVPETGDTTLTYKGLKTVYPSSFGIGLRFRPRNELIGLFELGLKYTAWNDYSSEFFGDFGLDNVFTYHMGVEHVFYSGVPLRLGFLYSPSPKDTDIREAVFTFGTGYAAYGWSVDFSGQIGWNNYRFPYLYPPGDLPLAWRDEVRESTFSGRLSFVRRF